MSDNDDTPVAAATAREADNGWGEQDRRTLYITIVGGLAANLGALILAGAALAVVRQSRRSSDFGYLETVLFGGVIGLLLIAFGTGLRRGRLFGRGFPLNRVGPGWQWWVGAGWALALLAVLVVTGLAAGVK